MHVSFIKIISSGPPHLRIVRNLINFVTNLNSSGHYTHVPSLLTLIPSTLLTQCTYLIRAIIRQYLSYLPKQHYMV